MEILSLKEIIDWKSFEDLVAAYFNAARQDNDFNVDTVEVKKTGSGSDGGRDILVTLTVNDSVSSFQRIWVVQCKFYEVDVNKSHLADINIPSLLHQYGAHGYLLVCKNGVTSTVSQMLEELSKNCWSKRSYLFWNGNDLLKRVRLKDDLLRHYFPKFYSFIEEKTKNKVVDVLKES